MNGITPSLGITEAISIRGEKFIANFYFQQMMVKGIFLTLLITVSLFPIASSTATGFSLETPETKFVPVPHYPPESYSNDSNIAPPLSNDVIIYPGIVSSPSNDHSPSWWETSEYMIGRVGVYIIFVESTGRVDPNREDWQEWRMELVEQGIYRALWWWMSQYPFRAPKLEFYVNRDRVIGYTDYEPITRPSTDHQLWVVQVLSGLGCGSGENHYVMAKMCADQIRRNWGMDWAFIIFVVDSYNDVDGNFADDWPAFAYLNGPYMVVTYDNDGWGIERMDRVVAHEIGHIFGATDEYNNEPEQGGYLYEWDTDGSRCIMDTNDWCISEGTRRQIGWVDRNRNGLPDLVENRLVIEILRKPADITDAKEVNYEGRTVLEPFPCRRPGCRSVTINKIASPFYTFNCAGTTSLMGNVTAKDGRFDSTYEEFVVTFSLTSPGVCRLHIQATDSLHAAHETYTHSFLHTYAIAVGKRSEPTAPRVDVGKHVRIGFKLVWAHDNSPVSYGEVSIDNYRATAVGDGWFEVEVTSPIVRKHSFQISHAALQLGGHGLRRVENVVGAVEVVWDRVVIELSSERQRIDVGSQAPLRVRAYYESDGLEVPATIYLNQPLIQESVGKYVYTATAVEDKLYGLKVFKSNTIEIIWDRVRIELAAEPHRVDVGSEAPIRYRAYYEYDGTVFKGRIYLDQPLRQYAVGRYTYSVLRIEDELYGLKSYKANSVEVVFDRVIVELEPVLKRVEIGRPAQISYKAYYEFDKQEFLGEVFLDKDLVSTVLGPVTYRVAGIRDMKFGLTAYTTNEVTVIFDRIVATVDLNMPPFLTNIYVRLYYESDGEPVTESTVLWDGTYLFQDTQTAGLYTTSIFTLSPHVGGEVSIDQPGFKEVKLAYNQLHLGNVLTYLAASTFTVLLLLTRRRRMRITAQTALTTVYRTTSS